jgi:hypothetical protein
MTNSPIKLSSDEIKEITDIQKKYQEVVFSLGELYLYRMGMEKVFESLSKTEGDLVKKHEETKKIETDWMEKISKKYGDGNLDIVNGLFIPENTSEKS